MFSFVLSIIGFFCRLSCWLVRGHINGAMRLLNMLHHPSVGVSVGQTLRSGEELALPGQESCS